MSEKKDLKVAPEAKALSDEALEGVAGGTGQIQIIGAVAAAALAADQGSAEFAVAALAADQGSAEFAIAALAETPVKKLEDMVVLGQGIQVAR